MHFDKHFSPEEAERTLPYVRGIVQDILAEGQRLEALIAEQDSSGQNPPGMGECMHRLNDHLHELESLGCFYKDWNHRVGLVDFPCLMEGREVLLCWRSDEPRILYYHDVHAGYAGRRPLPSPIQT